MQLQQALNLPVMSVEGVRLLKRLTMVVDDSTITKVFYPVFPPDKNATNVINWLTNKVKKSQQKTEQNL